jgi:hypothetical protein
MWNASWIIVAIQHICLWRTEIPTRSRKKPAGLQGAVALLNLGVTGEPLIGYARLRLV